MVERRKLWQSKSLVPKSGVREFLSAIAKYAAMGHAVYVGSSKALACSAFVSVAEYEKRRPTMPAKPESMDAEKFRKSWSTIRERVENTGQPTILNRNGEPLAVLIPTQRAFNTKIKNTMKAMGKSELSIIQSLRDEIAELRRTQLSPDEVIALRRALTMVIPMAEEWRVSRGLPPQLPSAR